MNKGLKFILIGTVILLTLILFIYLYTLKPDAPTTEPDITPRPALTTQSLEAEVNKIEQDLDRELEKLDSELDLLDKELQNF
jgi:hypothetical protein